MYSEHFGLRTPPFKITPDTEFFFGGGHREEILNALVYAIEYGAGIIKVVGEVGSGKTVLCRMLEKQLPESTNVVYLANPSIARDDILSAIAFDLDISLPAPATKQQLLEALNAYLLAQHRAKHRVVIFVEEAQAMPIDTLEELRLLSNLETQHEKLMQIILFGQPELDHKLQNEEIRQLRERISHAYTLNPLSTDDINLYLKFRMAKAGYDGESSAFTPAAVHAIANASSGLIRRVNIIADKALLAAFSDNSTTVQTKHAKLAINDCEFCKPDENNTTTRVEKLIYKFALPTASVLLAVILIISAVPLNQFLIDNASSSFRSFLQTRKEPVRPADISTQLPDQINDSESNTVVYGRLINARIDATRNWLAREADNQYCIQIMAIPQSGHQPLERFLRDLREEDRLNKVHIYQPIINDNRGFGVLYGTYESKEKARADMAVVSRKYKLKSPYLRTIKGIKNELSEIADHL